MRYQQKVIKLTLLLKKMTVILRYASMHCTKSLYVCTSHLYDIAQRQCCSLAFCLKHVAFELIGRLPVAYVNWGNSVLRVGYSFQAYSTETFNFAQVTTSCKQE